MTGTLETLWYILVELMSLDVVPEADRVRSTAFQSWRGRMERFSRGGGGAEQSGGAMQRAAEPPPRRSRQPSL